jgi:hypothetical protein
MLQTDKGLHTPLHKEALYTRPNLAYRAFPFQGQFVGKCPRSTVESGLEGGQSVRKSPHFAEASIGEQWTCYLLLLEEFFVV